MYKRQLSDSDTFKPPWACLTHPRPKSDELLVKDGISLEPFVSQGFELGLSRVRIVQGRPNVLHDSVEQDHLILDLVISEKRWREI